MIFYRKLIINIDKIISEHFRNFVQDTCPRVTMAPHFVLFEHAAGYALFRLQEFEEIATFLPQVEASVTDVSKFSQVRDK